MALTVATNGSGSASGWVNAALAPTVQLQGHKGPVFCTEFSASGSLLSTCSADKSIILWGPGDDVSGCHSVGHLTGHHNSTVVHTAFSADESYLVSASADCTLNVWDLATGGTTRRIRGHTK
jgi:WD40 repeat protein